MSVINEELESDWSSSTISDNEQDIEDENSENEDKDKTGEIFIRNSSWWNVSRDILPFGSDPSSTAISEHKVETKDKNSENTDTDEIGEIT